MLQPKARIWGERQSGVLSAYAVLYPAIDMHLRAFCYANMLFMVLHCLLIAAVVDSLSTIACALAYVPCSINRHLSCVASLILRHLGIEANHQVILYPDGNIHSHLLNTPISWGPSFDRSVPVSWGCVAAVRHMLSLYLYLLDNRWSPELQHMLLIAVSLSCKYVGRLLAAG